jgi:hypothetical protein
LLGAELLQHMLGLAAAELAVGMLSLLAADVWDSTGGQCGAGHLHACVHWLHDGNNNKGCIASHAQARLSHLV